MVKYLIYTDVHFCQYSSIVRKRGQKYSVRLHNLIDSISWAEHLADEEGCDEIITLGDFFDRSDLNSEEITALQDVYFSNKKHTFITGNHEANNETLTFSSAKIFQSMDAEVISDVKTLNINDKVDICLIPYLTNDVRLPLDRYITKNNKKKIVLSHNDIAGIQYGKFKSSSGFEINDILDNCTLFINGHLHNGYVINDRIILVGNLTGLNFNEDANKYEHYAYIMTIDDDGNITLDPRVNPYAFNFYKLYINDSKDIKQLFNLKNNSVLSISCIGSLIPDVENELKKLNNVQEFKIFATYRKNGYDTVEDADFKVEDHFQQFINYIKTKIEPSQVLDDEISLLGSN